jgi:hypothetical protein
MSASTTQPPIDLSNDQSKQLEKTLARHFEQIDLERLPSWRLNIEENGERIEQLDRFVAGSDTSFDAVVHQFVIRVSAHAEVRDLVSDMLEFKPGIRQVQKFAAELGIQLPGAARQPNGPPEPKAPLSQEYRLWQLSKLRT